MSLMTTQGGWWHDDSRFMWEMRDERGQPVQAMTDEYVQIARGNDPRFLVRFATRVQEPSGAPA